ncbi:hypothetical protein CBR_g19820 [Chara braunii]|uniref:Uncharacterized protein n=1 Tax=Chara braunii TaxID=69332 RepID=A0A388JU40_CHABU|nr:hypothetical protein CBR_g19820 [Chara braunii]|eukprot:GBG61287.1 hypothetical protein CBR_g19820 [Chara braunii]
MITKHRSTFRLEWEETDAHHWYSTYVWVDLPTFERDFMNRFDYVHPEQALYMIKDRVQKPLESVAEYRNRFYRMFVKTERVRPGHQELIAQELTILVAQLADDLPLDIISQDDEHPIPHVLSRTLMRYLQWLACVEGAAERIPPSQQQYLDPRTVCDPAFFRHPTAEQLAAIREEEEEEESTESDEGEDEREESGESDEVLREEDETPKEGSYSEHSEGEQSEEEEEEDEGEEENEEGPAESEWEAVPEEALRTGTEAEDPEAARKREETAVGKRKLEFASGASLHAGLRVTTSFQSRWAMEGGGGDGHAVLTSIEKMAVVAAVLAVVARCQVDRASSRMKVKLSRRRQRMLIQPSGLSYNCEVLINNLLSQNGKMMSFLKSPGYSRWRPSGSSNTTGALGKISKPVSSTGGGGGGRPDVTGSLRPPPAAEPATEVIRSLTGRPGPPPGSETSRSGRPGPPPGSETPRSGRPGPPPGSETPRTAQVANDPGTRSASTASTASGTSDTSGTSGTSGTSTKSTALPPSAPLSRTISLQSTPSKLTSGGGRTGPSTEVIRTKTSTGLIRTISLGSSANDRRDMTTGSSKNTSFVSSISGGGADTESDEPDTPRSRSLMAKEFAELALQQQRLPASTRDMQTGFERGQCAAEAAYTKVMSEPPGGKGGSQQGLELLHSLRKKLTDMELSGAPIRREDVTSAVNSADALLSQWALRDNEIQHEKVEVRKMAALFKQANEESKRMVEEARKIAQDEIRMAREKVKRAEEIARGVVASRPDEVDPEMQRLKMEVIEARRIKMLHQPTMVSHLELQVTGLQKSLLDKCQEVVKLRREIDLLKNPRKRPLPYKLDGLEFLGSMLSIVPTAPEGQLPYPCEIQWYRVHKDGRVESIAGATAAAYAPEPNDVECQMRVTIKYGNNSRKMEILESSGPLDPCPGLDQFVDLLYKYGTAHFNVVVLEQTPFSGTLVDRKVAHVFEISKDRVKLRKGRVAKARDPYSPGMQLGGARGSSESAAQSILWQTRGKEFLLQMESERERNAAILLARRFASEFKYKPPPSGESGYSSDNYTSYAGSESGSVRG